MVSFFSTGQFFSLFAAEKLLHGSTGFFDKLVSSIGHSKSRSFFQENFLEKNVKNQFKLQYSRWFSGNLVNLSIRKSGFQQVFNSAITKSLKLPTPIKRIQYSFSPNSIQAMADSSLEVAFGGSMI